MAVASLMHIWYVWSATENGFAPVAHATWPVRGAIAYGQDPLAVNGTTYAQMHDLIVGSTAPATGDSAVIAEVIAATTCLRSACVTARQVGGWDAIPSHELELAIAMSHFVPQVRSGFESLCYCLLRHATFSETMPLVSQWSAIQPQGSTEDSSDQLVRNYLLRLRGQLQAVVTLHCKSRRLPIWSHVSSNLLHELVPTLRAILLTASSDVDVKTGTLFSLFIGPHALAAGASLLSL